MSRFRFKYYMMRDDYRAGHRPFRPGARVTARQRVLQAIVLMTLPFYQSYGEGIDGFTIVDKRMFVDSSAWWTEYRHTERMKRMYRSRLGVELDGSQASRSDLLDLPGSAGGTVRTSADPSNKP